MAEKGKDNTGSGLDRRAFARLTVDLAARVDLDGRDPRAARIIDFCAGGLLLNVQGQENDYLVMAARQISRDDRLRVTFDADPGDGLRTFTIPVKVARLFPGGMGVAFDPPYPAAIRALQHMAEQSRTAARAGNRSAPAPQASFEAVALLAEIYQRAQRWLHESLDAAFQHARDGLFIDASNASNHDLQSEAMDALKDVERVQPSVRDAATQRVLRALERLSGDRLASLTTIMAEVDDDDDDGTRAGGGLALVDTGSFDDWLTTKNIITRHEPVLREAAYALSRRLQAVAGKRVDELANPLGLQQLGSAFNEAMQNIGLSQRSRRAIYKAFEESLVPALGEFLEQINTMLVDKGILTTVQRPALGAVRRPQAPRPPALLPAIEPAGKPGAETAAVDAPYPQQHHPGQAPRDAGGVNPWAATPLDPMDGAQAASAMPAASSGETPQPTYHSPIQSAVSQVGMQRAYEAARSLMDMQRALASGLAMPGGVQQLSAMTPTQQASGPLQPLLDALSSMQSSAEFNEPLAAQSRQAAPLKERLRAALQRSGVALGAKENEAIGVLGDLIEAVLGDPLIQANVKPRIQRLSVPLLRSAMQDRSFFEQDAHPARQVVNRLGMLGLPDALGSGQTGDSLQSAVDPILDRVLADPAAGPEAFAAVLPELDGLIVRQNERFADNMRNIVAARDQQQALLARRRSDDTVAPRRVAANLEPWFRRTERLKVGDSVVFGATGDNPQTRTLAWVADDHETFVFADREGRESAAVAQQELALDMLRGTAKVTDSADIPVMDRGVYQMLHDIHRSLAEEGRRDSVTGLIPVSTFESRVEEAIGRAHRRGSRHALLAMNLDGFATINKQCGRAAGDSLLRKLSRLLERQLVEQGCVTRAFADEFLILLTDHPFQDARRFAERQCRAIENSRVSFEGEQYPITVSIGLVPVTRAGESVGAVIENARAALAGAKRRGGNQLRVFDPDEDDLPVRDVHAADDDRDQDEAAANDASDDRDQSRGPADDHGQGDTHDDGLAGLVDDGRIVLQRQLVSPMVEGSGHKSHYELLLGVRDATGNVVAVSEDVLTEAERSERMADVDRWVIHNALQWMASNRRDVIRSGGYAITLSAAAFADDSLLGYVVGELTESTIPPAKIIFAVTESVAIDRLSSAVGFIRALRDYGCRFSIDDFGAGHATFAYLKTLPVDFVKIDGMFVRELADSDNDYAMVKSINEIAHLMGKLTIAKYADSDATVARLKELGVDFSRGDALGERETLH